MILKRQVLFKAVVTERLKEQLIADVNEQTLNASIRMKWLMSSSVIPSAKYSCDASPERFAIGSTASG